MIPVQPQKVTMILVVRFSRPNAKPIFQGADIYQVRVVGSILYLLVISSASSERQHEMQNTTVCCISIKGS